METESEASLARLFARYRGFVHHVVVSLGAPLSAAEDLVQEVFVVVGRKLSRYEERGEVRAWLAAIARNLTLRHLRRRAVERRHLAAAIPEAIVVDVTPFEDQLTRQDRAWRVRRCLEEIPTPQRHAFEQVELEGQAGQDVAEALGVSPNTIYSRTRLARDKLRLLARRRGI